MGRIKSGERTRLACWRRLLAVANFSPIVFSVFALLRPPMLVFRTEAMHSAVRRLQNGRRCEEKVRDGWQPSPTGQRPVLPRCAIALSREADTVATTAPKYRNFFLASSANLASQMQVGYHFPAMSTPAVATGLCS